DFLNSVSESSHALLALLNDILELSKLASGSIEFHPVLTNIKEFIAELDTEFRPAATQKKLTLIFHAEGVPDLYLDQPGLRQIFTNLISNAIKFTRQGCVKVSLEFKPLVSGSGNLIIRVSDTGIGVVPEDQAKMFEPFIQMTHMRGTNAMGTGTGLGLAIVKKIVEQQGGSIDLDSEPGRGSMSPFMRRTRRRNRKLPFPIFPSK
ncbi:MAG: HAMP domain-containing sensor histidine kinase, partial [Planctomycetia bacterium]|nr:HAMP domain-containing sensor histidine kinase [Planctomycetia bacterium]